MQPPPFAPANGYIFVWKIIYQSGKIRKHFSEAYQWIPFVIAGAIKPNGNCNLISLTLFHHFSQKHSIIFKLTILVSSFFPRRLLLSHFTSKAFFSETSTASEPILFDGIFSIFGVFFENGNGKWHYCAQCEQIFLRNKLGIYIHSILSVAGIVSIIFRVCETPAWV